MGLLVRPEIYEEDEEARAEKEGEAELIIAKQRNGPVGEISLTFFERIYPVRRSRAQCKGTGGSVLKARISLRRSVRQPRNSAAEPLR